MFKDYLKQEKISMYALAKKSGVAYSTINDIVNERVEINNCKVGVVRALAQALNISMEMLCDVASQRHQVISEEYKTKVTISVSNKSYYADFSFRGKEHKIRLCPVNTINTEMIHDIAEYVADDYIENLLFEELEVK